MGKEKIPKYTPMANEDERYYEFHERVAILLGEIESPTEKQISLAEKIAKKELLERKRNGKKEDTNILAKKSRQGMVEGNSAGRLL